MHPLYILTALFAVTAGCTDLQTASETGFLPTDNGTLPFLTEDDQPCAADQMFQGRLLQTKMMCVAPGGCELDFGDPQTSYTYDSQDRVTETERITGMDTFTSSFKYDCDEE